MYVFLQHGLRQPGPKYFTMKKTFFTALLLAAFFANAQQNNTLLNADFWKKSPDITAVQSEITKGANASELNPNAFDPTVLAINNDAPLSTIKFLLEQQGNGVNKITHDGRTYLHWAAYKGNVELVDYLIHKGYDINLEDSHGNSPLAFAASNGLANIQVFENFFKAGIAPKKKYANGATLLMLCAPNDKELKVTNYLVSKGLSVKDTDNNGATVFDYAARTGNLDNLKSFLAKGSKATGNALIIAAQGARRSSNTIEVYRFLVEEQKLKPAFTSKEGYNVLHYLVRKPNQSEIITYFLEKGAEVNQPNLDGNTPFIIAAGGKDLQTLRLLLPKVKDINAVNSKGQSALTNAIASGSTEIAALLIDSGANINITDKSGNNLTYYLIESYRPERGPQGKSNEQDDFDSKLNLLKVKGFNVSMPQKDGSTLLHLAAAKNELALFAKLDGIKIDINAKNAAGLTALHRAALTAKDDAVLKYLVGAGANKALKTDLDETAYDLANENEYLKKNNISIEFLK